MKKVMVALVTLSLTTTSALFGLNVTEGKRFLGLELGYSKIQGDTLFENNHESDDKELGFRVGVENLVWRTMLTYSQYDNSKADQNLEKFIFSIDYLLLNDGKEKGLNPAPYVGLNASYADYESTFINENTGFLYGVEGGMIWSASQMITLDLGYRYMVTSQMENFDHSADVVFGLHFNY